MLELLLPVVWILNQQVGAGATQRLQGDAVGVHIVLSQLGGTDLFVQGGLPVGYVLADLYPERGGQLFFFVADWVFGGLAQQTAAGELDTAEGEEFTAAVGKTGFFHLGEALEALDIGHYIAGQL